MEGELGLFQVYLQLFGTFTAEVDGCVTALTSRKAQALLCYLALHPNEAVSREKLATLLWTETAGEFARTNLRQCVAVIRKSLNHTQHPVLVSETSHLRLDTAVVTTDVSAFDQALSDAGADNHRIAIELYRGELLEGIGLEDCEFHQWLQAVRQQRHEAFVGACHAVLRHYRAARLVEKEFALASRVNALDPIDEIAQRSLMYCHHKLGKRHLALRQYEKLKQQLHDQLNAAPEPETLALYTSMLAPQESATDSTAAAEAGRKEVADDLKTSHSPRENIAVRRKIVLTGKKKWSAVLLSLCVISAVAFYVQLKVKPVPIAAGKVSVVLDNAFESSERRQPVIAVLPFVNLSGDAKYAYFSDGLSEDLITDLSRIDGLTVIARSSSFIYRTERPDTSHLADVLGASVILHGSVRRAGRRVRVNAELTNTADGTQLWAKRFDRELSDVFLVQDEISHTIVNELSIKLSQTEQEKLDRVLSVNPDVYDLFLRSLRPLREITPTGSAEARRILEQVVELDSGYARAWANLGLTYGQDLAFGFAENRELWIEKGFYYANRAAELDNTLPQLHFMLGGLYQTVRDFDRAIASALRSIEFDPNYADGFGMLSQNLMFNGDLVEARRALVKAKQLNPHFTFTYLWLEGQIAFLEGDYTAAVKIFEEINSRNPSFISGRLMLISTYGQLNQQEDAEWEIAELLTMRPEFSLENERSIALYQLSEHTDLYIEGLQKAGL